MTNYRPLRLCKCGKYDCDLGTIQEQDREEEKVHQFLFGLDDTVFRMVRSNLVSRVHVQSLEEVYNIVHQEEDLVRNGTKTHEEQSDMTTFAAHKKFMARRDDKDKSVMCKHCHILGHASDHYYAVIGYPEWWEDRPQSRTMQPQGRGRSSSNGQMGRRRGLTYANVVHVPNFSTQEHANYVLTDKDRDGVSGLNDTHWR